MRTLEKLLELDGKVYIRIGNSETAKRFLRNAEREGFLMQSGKKPTECEPNYFYRVFHDKTIEPSGRGFAGSMYKHTIHGKQLKKFIQYGIILRKRRLINYD